MSLTVTFEDSELPELRVLLDRAMNTWDPRLMPAWVKDLSAAVDLRLQYPDDHPTGERPADAG